MFSRFVNLAVKIAGYAFAGTLLAGSLTFAYSMLAPIDVLQDWKLKSTQDTYVAGEEAIFKSSFTKVMDTSRWDSESERMLVCDTLKFPINEAVASNPKGSRSNELHIVIPDNIPQLPKTCRVDIKVKYFLYGYRLHPETTSSDNFTVERNKNV